MKALSAYWTNKGNILVIQCNCGNVIHHELRHSLVICECGEKAWYTNEFKAFNDRYSNVQSVINWNKFKRSGASNKTI
jgi:hypothetical protein